MRIERNGMDTHKILVIAIIISLTIISGFGDAQGFIHAAHIWHGNKIIWPEVAKSALGFTAGTIVQWVSIRFIQDIKIFSPEIQTLLWFSVTMIGIALLSGDFSQWRHTDQVVAIVVLLGIAWLLLRAAR